METRSNNVLVGAFVLLFTAALAVFIVWLANDSGGTKREYDIFFKQSVDGLNKGAQVQFSGVPSGQVREIALWPDDPQFVRSEEHTSELQSLMRISYAVFCLKKKTSDTLHTTQP